MRFLSVLLIFLVSLASAADLGETELRGKQIFLHGNSGDDTPISAFLGIDRVELPASAVPCASCHGADGRGRPEGGVVPSNIRWSELAKPYGHEHGYGRRHPVFDEASVAAAITGGIDPAGNALDYAMPRYGMAQADLDALIAYLKRLETDFDPGVSETGGRLATMLPLSGPAMAEGEAIRAVLNAYTEKLNGGGGINGRAVELQVIPLGETREQSIANVRAALQMPGVFALVAVYSAGIESEITALLEEKGIPLVGPMPRALDTDLLRSPQIFSLYSGYAELMRSLSRFAVRSSGDQRRRQVIVGPDNDLLRNVATMIGVRKNDAMTTLPYPATGFDLAAAVAGVSETDDILFLGGAADLGRFLDALAEAGPVPRLFLPASAVTPALMQAPAKFNGRLFVAYPTLPGDVSQDGRALYASLGEHGALPAVHLSSQIAALAAARVLAGAMQRSGRALNRERLGTELEGMSEFATGLTPPISFSLNRRIGALGAHIARVDLDLGRPVPVSAWQAFD